MRRRECFPLFRSFLVRTQRHTFLPPNPSSIKKNYMYLPEKHVPKKQPCPEQRRVLPCTSIGYTVPFVHFFFWGVYVCTSKIFQLLLAGTALKGVAFNPMKKKANVLTRSIDRTPNVSSPGFPCQPCPRKVIILALRIIPRCAPLALFVPLLMHQ